MASYPAFKAILQFLSDKRYKEELDKFTEEHRAYFVNKAGQSSSVSVSQSKKQKYIYTEELKKFC